MSSLLRLVRGRVEVSEEVAGRARALERLGLRGLDALHVASAEAGSPAGRTAPGLRRH